MMKLLAFYEKNKTSTRDVFLQIWYFANICQKNKVSDTLKRENIDSLGTLRDIRFLFSKIKNTN